MITFLDGRLQTTRHGVVIASFDAYKKAQDLGGRVLCWIYLGDADFAAQLATLAFHQAGKARRCD